jgi:hypothetical protein
MQTECYYTDYLPGGTEESQSGYPVSRLSFEHGTSQIRRRKANHSLATLGQHFL